MESLIRSLLSNFTNNENFSSLLGNFGNIFRFASYLWVINSVLSVTNDQNCVSEPWNLENAGMCVGNTTSGNESLLSSAANDKNYSSHSLLWNNGLGFDKKTNMFGNSKRFNLL